MRYSDNTAPGDEVEKCRVFWLLGREIHSMADGFGILPFSSNMLFNGPVWFEVNLESFSKKVFTNEPTMFVSSKRTSFLTFVEGAEDKLLSTHSTRSLLNELAISVADKDPKNQIRATLLLKRSAENKSHFSRDQLVTIFDSLSELKHWEAKLHICQMLQHVKIPRGSKEKVAWFLERCLLEHNKFLRAWAYNGFYELAKQHRQYHEYAMEQLDHGEAEKSAAIKTRIRNIRKAMKEIC